MEDEIRRLVQEPRISVEAQTFLRKWPSFSEPCLMVCDDKRQYVVKGGCNRLSRAICNEQIVARLGLKIGAPVAVPCFVAVPAELIQAERQLSHITSALSHGNQFHENHSDRAWVAHATEPGNRIRFALLSVLYGWAYAGDRQLIYANTAPHLVLSVDHGHFFPSGPHWCAENLVGTAPAECEPDIVSDAALTSAEIKIALQQLGSITTSDVCQAVSSPPDEWGLSLDERFAIARFLWMRREQLLQSTGS